MTGPLHWHELWMRLHDRLLRKIHEQIEITRLLEENGMPEALHFRRDLFRLSRRARAAANRAHAAVRRWNRPHQDPTTKAAD